jgi:histidinol-phosphatase (PHP family)
MDERVLHAKVDYLIGSVHFIDDWGFDNPEFIGRYEHEDIDVIWQKYFDAIEAMAKTKLFDIVGHLDLIKVFKFMPNKDIVTMALPALHAIKEANMALELNVAGYRKPIGEPYPSKALLTEAYRLGIPITFASDAHKPEQVALYDKEIITFAKEVGYSECVYFKERKRFFVTF